MSWPFRLLQLYVGYPPIIGRTILDKRRYVREHHDDLRLMLMAEPRGHYDMYGAILVEKDIPEADLAVLFMHNEGMKELSLIPNTYTLTCTEELNRSSLLNILPRA